MPDDFWFPRPPSEVTIIGMGFGVGDLLAGKYRVERIIGRGGMGIVLAARHVDLGELFAVKLVEGVDRSGGERLLREARASARLRGEHIVRLHDVGWLAEKTPFLVLELVRGESIAAELRARGPFSAEDTAEVILHACLALAEAHASGLVHRDVKASNLLASKRPDGSRIVKLLDFGIAKLSDGADDQRITGDSATLGSPAYMSPEQIRDAHAVDARTDIWALGVLAQELFTGKPPFAAFTTSGVLASIVADEPAALPDTTPAALRAAIAGCLVKTIDQRLSTVAEVADAIAGLLPDGPSIAQRVRSTLRATEEASLAASPPDRAHAPPPDRGLPTGTTQDEPTYDPTELSADEARGSRLPAARDAGLGETALAALGAHGVPSSEVRAHGERRRASPWIIPAIALPLATALAFFASSRQPPAERAAAIAKAASAAPPLAPRLDEPPVPAESAATTATAPPTTSASPDSATTLAPAAPPPPKNKAGGTPPKAPSARPPAPSPVLPAPPPADDLDRFGGRK